MLVHLVPPGPFADRLFADDGLLPDVDDYDDDRRRPAGPRLTSPPATVHAGGAAAPRRGSPCPSHPRTQIPEAAVEPDPEPALATASTVSIKGGGPGEQLEWTSGRPPSAAP